MNYLQIITEQFPASETQIELREFDKPCRCVITGELVKKGYTIKDITTTATNEFMDTFHGTPDGVVSEYAGRVMKTQRLGNICIRNGKLYKPMLSRKSAMEQARPCWSDLFRSFKEGDEVFLIVTTDFKKRLWPQARAGFVGNNIPVFCYDSGSCMNEVRDVDYEYLIHVLDEVERLYNLGFSKVTMAQSLFKDNKLTMVHSFDKVTKWERVLRTMRATNEFDLAVLIAQKDLK